jgi:branched-chain amino acid transport system permease protein
MIMTFIWGAVATNWNITLGYGGMFHIAQLTLFAVGGYTSAMVTSSIGISPWLGLLIGGVVSMFASLVIGLPSLRVKGIYLILLTFAFHYSVKELVNIFKDQTGGSMGLVVSSLSLGNWGDETFYYYFSLFLLFVSIGLTIFFIKSHIGKALVALRDSEVLAMCSGVNAFKYKMITFVAASFITGIVGALYSSYLSVISPEIFDFSLIVNGLGMIVIGGMGTILGPFIGSFVITLCMEFLNSFQQFSPIILGVAILLVLLFVPNGIVPLFIKWLKPKEKSATREGDQSSEGEKNYLTS